MRVPGNGPLLAALAFIVAGWHPSRVLVGYYESTFYLLFPLMLYLILMATRRYLYLLLAVILSAACLMQVLGGAAAFALWAAVHLLLGMRRPEHRWRRPVRGIAMLSLVLGLAVLLGAVKFVPVMDLMGRGSMDRMPGPLLWGLPSSPSEQFIYKRTFNYYTTYRKSGLEKHLDFFYDSPGSLLECLVNAVDLETSHVTRSEGDIQLLRPEYPYINVGYMVLVLGLLGLVLRRYATRSSAWALVLFTLVNFGWHAPVDLFRLLAFLPLVNEMTRPLQYFNFFIYVELVLLAGAAFAWLEGRLRQRWQRLALLGLCLAAIAPTALENTARYRRAFLYPMPEVDRAEQFHQVKLSNIYLREQSAEGYGNTYLNVLRGVGSVIWDSNIKMSENALPRYLVDDVGIRSPNILYRGEAWFAEPGNQVGRISITPNRIEVAVDLKSPGLLTINQNYDPSWKVEGGELLRKEGLLQVRCKAGRRTVMLHYSPPAFYKGLGISLATLLALALAARFRRRWWMASGVGEDQSPRGEGNA